MDSIVYKISSKIRSKSQGPAQVYLLSTFNRYGSPRRIWHRRVVELHIEPDGGRRSSPKLSAKDRGPHLLRGAWYGRNLLSVATYGKVEGAVEDLKGKAMLRRIGVARGGSQRILRDRV